MKIKEMMKVFGIAAIALTIAGPVAADTINFGATDVGNLDTLIGQTSDLTEGGTIVCSGGNGSNPTAEECWAENAIGGGADLTYDDSKSETVDWMWTDEGNIAFELEFGGGYYIIKNGIGGGNSIWVLFQNVASLDWGVIAGSFADIANLGSDMTISHVTEFDPTSVPEPGTLALLGLGLLGMAARRGRKAAKI